MLSATQVKRARSEEAEAGREEEDGRAGEGDAEEGDELYCSLRSDVVGVQYYRGLVGRGQYVMLRREPTNQYDPNAVQVMNASGIQVGHIPRAVASKLADFMDEGLISVEGMMIGQNLDMAKHFQLGINISLYGKPSLRDTLEPLLQQAFGSALLRRPPVPQSQDVPASQASQSSQGRAVDAGAANRAAQIAAEEANRQARLKRIMEGLSQVPEKNQHVAGVLDSLTKDIDVMGIPPHPDPPGVAKGNLNVDLLYHQSQALQWMIERENPKLPTSISDPAVQFWVKQAPQVPRGKEHWLNVATRSPQIETPVLGRGGILADGMGLGKTLTVLALALATKSDTEAGETGSTLIVCPLSVLSNWEKQITDHIVAGNLTWYLYHGRNKSISSAKLSKFDIVITTYQTVAMDRIGSVSRSDAYSLSDDEFEATQATQKGKKKQKTASRTLAGINWKRILADEGHQLANPKSQMAQAFAALSAARRWICTGTPIVNSPADLGSLLTCIRVCRPLDDPAYYKTLLLRPLNQGLREAAQLLQAVVGQSLLRRTKESRDSNGLNLVTLPPLTYFKLGIALDDVTRTLYDELEAAAGTKFINALATGQGKGNVLAMITRLRQLCLSAELVPQSFIDDMRSPITLDENGDGKPVCAHQISPELRKELVAKLKLAISDSEECAICSDEMVKEEARITDCGHPGCLSCLAAWLVKASTCPICRHSITLESLIQIPEDESEYVEVEPTEVKPIKSAKIDELVKYLTHFDPSDKSLVFSQFTSFLNHVEVALKQAGISCCRFDGSMPQKKRQAVIATFQQPVVPGDKSYNPKVMLISLKSGAVGLNLTAASNVFLCDPWWQSAIEAQAIDRVHRMGQTKPVHVFQLIADGTIESKVLDIQKKKDDLVATAFEKITKETVRAKREAKFEDLKMLFGVK